MSHWFFIINPTAGHRNGLRVWKSIQKELIKRKVEHRSFLTEHPDTPRCSPDRFQRYRNIS